ncbi:zinc finger protein 40 isoform X2 [Spea bombifrons]|uniref:zinc finger protein 40 isoform X2 n=1 Tax=Spea bombifrons TaxID=233779 RepID=UPI0023498671|nr:zinc finger protein 40 isoform X2 [Spea bombifrons]
MPRTKQIHPKNLRDKIEEAQKKLNCPKEPHKESPDVGSRTFLDSVKGVKRKKIVTENHHKKIPKSPLKNVSKDKQRNEIEAVASSSSEFCVSSSSKYKELLVLPEQKQSITQFISPELIVQSVKSGISMQAKKLSVPPDLCNGRSEKSEYGNKMATSKERTTSNPLPSSHRSANINSQNVNKQYACVNSAFDVLLKAMEPELNTLNQSWPPCGTQTEKQGHLVKCTTSSPLPHHETSLRYLDYHSSGSSGQLCMSTKGSPSALVHSVSEYEQSRSERRLQEQKTSACPSSLEAIKHQQVYSVAVTSSIANPSPSTVTQVVPVPGNSSSSTSHSRLSVNSSYNLAQATSLASGEQMCNIVLKDQKPKKQGKYICEYCNRACAKPSVLLKHIRSHTGERPYPCVTCGFSFKTKSNLYKHKKSHAHAIKVGLGLQPDSGAMVLSSDSEKVLCIHSDVDESGESDDEYTSEERQDEMTSPGLECSETVNMVSKTEDMLHKESQSSLNCPVAMLQQTSLKEKNTKSAVTDLPKVVIYPVSISPLRADSPKVLESTSEKFVAQMPDFKTKIKNQNVLRACSLSEVEQPTHKKDDVVQVEDKHLPNMVTSHALLQRQQATDCSQEEQNKCMLSPRSLGSTDSGYFSRSESADQAMSLPTPFPKRLPSADKDISLSVSTTIHKAGSVFTSIQPISVEKSTITTGTMRPPLGTRTLEERISKLISDNEAVVDDKQLDSVKPRRTSLSRRGSIDSPKSYIFKDSFQFDLKPVGRRTSSSSDVPKSPFTPTDKSKQVFFLSVPSQYPSMDCLPITRSNSMPTTGYSAVPPGLPTSQPLRVSQSFDEKIGSLYDDVFTSGPSIPQQTAHPRTLVRQVAVEDSSNTEHYGLGPARSVDESYPGNKVPSDVLLPRSKSFIQGSSLDKTKKTHQGRGTMFECETCRNRYRKLENFENHKKFYCSELHGPKSKTVSRETEHSSAVNSSQPQILHYRVGPSSGVLDHPLQIRKRRKMKSVGDDDEPQQTDNRIAAESTEAVKSSGCTKNSSTITILGSQSCTVSTLNPQVQLVARSTETRADSKQPTVEKNVHLISQENVRPKSQGTGISVIQHTNSLSRPNSFEKSESVERVSPVPFYEPHKSVNHPLNRVGIRHDERSSCSHNSPNKLVETPRPEVQESQHGLSAERTALNTQSRLVRQHNIQVPEILVTEEPDKVPESQTKDQETQEKFCWPQRSGSLSNLPTEKLPPKKKRIRLADLGHSSGESSFESTLSRSLSRESSLSRASSLSASFDKEEYAKPDSSTKVDGVNKSSEFLTIPTGLNVFGGQREMRRASSEQINCTQPSMEVTDYRSKSFDCGSMSRSRSLSPINTMSPKSPLGATNIGHVPLLERRRGPLVKQISLNIGAEDTAPLSKHVGKQVLPQANVPIENRYLTEINVCSKEANKQKTASELSFLAENAQPASVVSSKHSLYSTSVHTTKATLFDRDFSHSIQSEPRRNGKDTNTVLHAVSELSRFAPKYVLKIPKMQENNVCSSSHSVSLLPNRSSTSTTGKSWNVIAGGTESLQNQNQSVKLSGKCQNAYSVSVPVHNYSYSGYGFSSPASPPDILVTQDQGNQTACRADFQVPNIREKLHMSKSQEESSRPISSPNKADDCDNIFLKCNLQKVPVPGLLPQQEASASSKRMLSPANSLDIAMEKNQKRVKDENGAACHTNSQQVHLVNIKPGDSTKPRKPMLVRQLCTTSEFLDQDNTLAPGRNNQANRFSGILLGDSSSPKKAVSCPSNHIRDVVEYQKNKSPESFCPEAETPQETSPGSTQSCVLKPVYSTQEKLAFSTKNIQIQGQVKLGAAISVVNMGDMQRLSFPSLKTTTSFTWCYLLKRKPMHLPQSDQKTSAYASWTISPNNPNIFGLPTKVALSLLNSKQKSEKFISTLVKTSHPRRDILVYSSKWKNSMNKLSSYKSPGSQPDDKKNTETYTDQDKEVFLNKAEPRRVKIFDGGYKSNEDYVYIRGRGRGKYICEECGIRCKKPSMLKKHIRTHTDVRPYHCNYCNFSFKTKGNLTKHMKSKAHSKKCMDMGVAVGPIDDQDTDDSGERPKYTGDRSGFDAEDSDGAEDDDNDNEDEDEDSQTESGLSATPSVTASPQHYPFRNSQQEASSADEDSRTPHCFSQSNSMDILPKALMTRMTAITAAAACTPENHEAKAEAYLQKKLVPRNTEALFPKSLCHQMSVDYPDPGENSESSTETMAGTSAKNASPVNAPPSPVDRSTQTMDSCAGPTDYEGHRQKSSGMAPQPTSMATPPTHLYSHLPLHSQQPVTSPFSMIPVGGIQIVPAGLTAYSTFVPIQAGPMQLTIPAVGVIHRTTSSPGEKVAEVPGTSSPIGMAEVNGVLPCIPIGQINMPSLSAQSLQPIQPLNVETLNILGLSNTHVAPHIHHPGLTLNALGLQVLTAPHSNPSPQTHIPGLQIVNIALPTLIPSISPLTVEGQGVADKSPSSSRAPCQSLVSFSGSDTKSTGKAESSPITPDITDSHMTLRDCTVVKDKNTTCTLNADKGVLLSQHCNVGTNKTKTTSAPDLCLTSQTSKPPASQAPSPIRHQRRVDFVSRQSTVRFCDSSSDDDEDKLVIAT